MLVHIIDDGMHNTLMHDPQGCLMSDQTVRFEIADGIAIITLSRPRVRNAVDRETAQALSAAMDQLDDRDDVRVGVLTGGGEMFSAGMDLKAFNATGGRPIDQRRGPFGIITRPPEKPLLAAVEGAALGGGFEIALACDLIVAGQHATFGLPEVKRGLVAAAGGVLRLPRRVPHAVAMEMILTGAPIDVVRASTTDWSIGSWPMEPPRPKPVLIGHAIAENAPLAVRTAKLLANQSVEWPLEEAFGRQEAYASAVRASNDAKEGAAAFVERRKPRCTGY
jgi:enoyl-CoA hydratase/carnithine racemase